MDTSSYKDCLLPQWYEINPDIENAFEKLLTTPRPKRKNIPAGYELDLESGVSCNPIPDVLVEIIKVLGDVRYNDRKSLREAVEYLADIFTSHGLSPINSVGGISHVINRIEADLGLTDKRRNTSPVRVKKIKQERIKERKAKGKGRMYNYTRPMKDYVEYQKALTEKRNELKVIKEKEQRLQKAIAQKAARLKLKGDPTKTPEELEAKKARKDTPHEAAAKDSRVPEGREIAFVPNPGPQTDFLSAGEDIVLYGGAAGGGKSYAMVVDPLRYAHKKHHRAVIIRKTMPELKEIIDVSRDLYPKYDPKAKYRESDHTWTFSSGAQIMFRFLERPADKFKFQGIAYTYIGFDELSQQPTSEGFEYLRTRLRSASDPNAADGIPCYVRATANPGSLWVYEMFIKDRTPNKAFIKPGTENSPHPITMKFIPAKLEDNPYLDSDGRYRSVLESLDPTLRKQLLEGDWLAANDNMFSEFDLQVHVVDPFMIPKHWNRTAGLDYGYKDPSAAVWFAVDPEDGSIIVYDEFLETGLTGREFALKIQEREAQELVPVDHPIDWSIYARTGHSGPTIAESMLSVRGFMIRRADKNREAGWVQIHELLRKDPVTGAPKIKIFSTCKGLIKQIMSAKVSETNPRDIATIRNSDGHWDLLDALRYGVMSRPRLQTYEDQLLRRKEYNSWNRYRGYFR